MIWTIFLVSSVLWALGIVTSNTMGGFIHILLGVSISILFIRVFQGRRLVS